jgi:hypothetical protein
MICNSKFPISTFLSRKHSGTQALSNVLSDCNKQHLDKLLIPLVVPKLGLGTNHYVSLYRTKPSDTKSARVSSVIRYMQKILYLFFIHSLTFEC